MEYESGEFMLRLARVSDRDCQSTGDKLLDWRGDREVASLWVGAMKGCSGCYIEPMRIDMYSKVVLTVIALLLGLLVCRQYVSPESVAAQGSFSGVQMAVTPLGYSFFDSRSGELWEYSGANLHAKHRLKVLGQALTAEK
jgi:hypothetical protein